MWGSILLLALLNNALPFTLFGWGQTHIASGLASILNATTPIWGVVVAHFLTRDERMSPRKIAGVLLGFGGVATMIGPSLLSSLGGGALAQLACVTASLSYALAAVWARRFRRLGISPLSVTTGQLTAGALIMLPLSMIVDRPWTHALPPLSAWARDRRAGAAVHRLRLCALFPADRFRRARPMPCWSPCWSRRSRSCSAALFLGETLAPQDFAGLGLIALGLAAIDGRLLSLLWRAGFGEQLSRLGAGPVEVADVAPDLLAVGVEQDRGRQHLRAQRARQRHLRVLVGIEVGDPVALQERHDRRVRRVVLADRDHVRARHRRACGQPVERRQFLDARRAPARPQIHQRRLARELGEADLVAVGVVEDRAARPCPCGSGRRP